MAFDTDSTAALAALIDYAKKAGADAAEASLAAREAISAEVRMGELEGMEREEGRSVALRAFIGKRQAAASSTDLSAKGLQALAERVAAMAKAAPEDKFCGLLEERYLAKGPAPDLEQSDTARPTPEQLLDLAKSCEAASLAIPGVANSGGAGASFERSTFVYAASTGFEGAESATSYSLGTQPVAEKDGEMERDYEWRTKRFLADLPSPEDIGRIAGERTARRLGARKVASTKAPVIFENRLAGRIISPFFSAISGASVARGVSFLKDKLGQRVFAEGFRIREDPFVKRGAASRWFDGEGGAVAPAALIEDGVLTMWLLNASAARQLGLEPNGHATSGHGGPPGIGASNLFVKPGAEDLPSLMKTAGKGLFVTDMFSPSLNMNTGDWSVGVAGYWFENGAVAHPVSEVTVAGNLLDIFARLRCGADVDTRGSLEIASLIVDDLAIGGV
ncbi:MAG: TldD/PmbA family protein [Hyphomonadaceae bacterium]|nr:TldD/PmbA family protein [Hyphomonadaceae bacterium]GIK49661.1 MAG: modulator protein [Alphaproteobacteria bacterium]